MDFPQSCFRLDRPGSAIKYNFEKEIKVQTHHLKRRIESKKRLELHQEIIQLCGSHRVLLLQKDETWNELKFH
jgi:hypothetical protein